MSLDLLEPGQLTPDAQGGAVRVLKADTLEASDGAFRLIEAELDRLFPARQINRVLLVLPPDGSRVTFSVVAAKAGRLHNNPPYGLGVLAAHLERDGVEVRVLNLNNAVLKAARESVETNAFDYDAIIRRELAAAIDDFDPDIVGLSTMFSMAHDSSLNCRQIIGELAPDVPIALGGVHFTNSFNSTLTRETLLADTAGADFIFMFEAELAFRNFVRCVNRKAGPQDLAQIVLTRTSPVLYLDNRAVPERDDLDVIPSFSLLQLEELSHNGVIGALHYLVPPGTRIATSLSNRGCRAQCTFCSVRQFNGVGVRARSVEAVVDELLVLKHKHGVQHIAWLDDDFLFDHRRCLKLFDLMIKRDVGMTWDWSNGVIAASCTDELIGAAAAAGCVGMYIGMESGNPHVLRQIKKPGNVRHFLEAASVLRKYEQINTRVYLMFGFPGETFGMIQDTINVAREMNLDWNAIHPLQPLPNTPIYETVVEYRNFADTTYNTSAYGKMQELAARVGDVLVVDFENIFEENDLSKVPHHEQYDQIWAHMFFNLNYRRLFAESRRAKIEQAYSYVNRMATQIIPMSGFAWYFRNFLLHRLTGSVDVLGRERLSAIMATHGLYKDKFAKLGMSLDFIDQATQH